MIPRTRDSLLEMKIQVDQENIQAFVKTIYGFTVQAAAYGTYYRVHIDNLLIDNNMRELYRANMDTILEKLRDLFPDSKVSCKVLVPDNHSNYHDLSTFTVDMYRTVTLMPQHAKEFIIIDWS